MAVLKMITIANIMLFDKTERKNKLFFDKTERNNGVFFDKTERNNLSFDKRICSP